MPTDAYRANDKITAQAMKFKLYEKSSLKQKTKIERGLVKLY